MRLGNLRAGFTLVEIMIVVSLIGLLAAIAIPNYMHSRAKAYESSCINNLRQIQDAIHVWAFETRQGPAQSVTFSDISGYLKRTVVCPCGGVGFTDSYLLTTVDQLPSCKLSPDTHYLIEDPLSASDPVLAGKHKGWDKNGQPLP